MSENEEKIIDEHTGTETTGHEWDGIKELNTPLPRWWLWTFYATIVWSVGYMIAYPAIPLISDATKGVLGFSSRADLHQSVQAAADANAHLVEQIDASDVGAIPQNDELARFARLGGESLYKVYCSQCHGTGAQGAKGYPNLNDDEWIWGGTIEEIYHTIAHGVRYEPDLDTRFNDMPAFLKDQILSREQVDSVAEYTAFLGGLEGGHESELGAQIYADNCSSCHGDRGEGKADLGGPTLNNAIWLYSGDFASIRAQIADPQHGEMPAWSEKLSDASVKQLAVYIHGLGGGS